MRRPRWAVRRLAGCGSRGAGHPSHGYCARPTPTWTPSSRVGAGILPSCALPPCDPAHRLPFSIVAAVAVVIPAYNPGSRLRCALESVVAQTFRDWECIVVDDGGTEDLSWIDDYHPQVWRHRQENAGVSAARNVGLMLTSAPFVAFLDQDDEWLPAKLGHQVAVMRKGADLCWTSFVWIHEINPDRPAIAHPVTYQEFLADGHLCLSSLMVRRAAVGRIGGFSPMLRVQQDYELLLRLLAAGSVAAPLSTILTRYNLHSNNVSGDYWTACRERRNILELHRISAIRRGDGATVRAARAGRHRMTRMYGIKAFDAFRATRRPIHLARAVVWNPRYVVPALVRAVGRTAPA